MPLRCMETVLADSGIFRRAGPKLGRIESQNQFSAKPRSRIDHRTEPSIRAVASWPAGAVGNPRGLRQPRIVLSTGRSVILKAS